jgi:hypothetical protein
MEVGLLENKTYPWMTASSDGVAVVGFQDDENIVASIEIKTRVASERIKHMEPVAAKYQHMLIVCEIGDDTWNECVEAEHSTQVLLQPWVIRLQTAFYIVVTTGTTTTSGKITYIVIVWFLLSRANFFYQYSYHIGQLLIPFYRMSNIADLWKAFPKNLEKTTV